MRGLAMQGRPDSHQWLLWMRITYSMDGTSWDSVPGEIETGIVDRSTIVEALFPGLIWCRYLRVHTIPYSDPVQQPSGRAEGGDSCNSHCSMRAAVLIDPMGGCGAASCPADSTGTNVPTGDCTCDSGFSGTITATDSSPFFSAGGISSGVATGDSFAAFDFSNSGSDTSLNEDLIINVDGTPQTITLRSDVTSATDAVTALAGLSGAVASVGGTNVVITSASRGMSSTVAIVLSGSGMHAQALFGTAVEASGAIGCAAESCPADSTGTDIPSGCTCDAGFTAPPSPPCTLGDVRYTFEFNSDVLGWVEAEAACVVLGGHLATVESADRQTEMTALGVAGSADSYWIGGHKAVGNTDGQWSWVGDQCTIAQIGGGPVVGTTFPIEARFACPSVVDSSNWLGGETYSDQFAVSQSEEGITVVQTNNGDTNSGWGMDLHFHCCTINPINMMEADVSSTYIPTWDTDAGGDGERVDSTGIQIYLFARVSPVEWQFDRDTASGHAHPSICQIPHRDFATGGAGTGGSEAMVAGSPNSAAECERIVRADHPAANGASYRGLPTPLCYAETGMTGQTPSSGYTSCQFDNSRTLVFGKKKKVSCESFDYVTRSYRLATHSRASSLRSLSSPGDSMKNAHKTTLLISSSSCSESTRVLSVLADSWQIAGLFRHNIQPVLPRRLHRRALPRGLDRHQRAGGRLHVRRRLRDIRRQHRLEPARHAVLRG